VRLSWVIWDLASAGPQPENAKWCGAFPRASPWTFCSGSWESSFPGWKNGETVLWQGAAALQGLQFLLEQIVFSGCFPQLLLQPGDLHIPSVRERLFNTARPPLRNCSRCRKSRAAVTSGARESNSRPSLRCNRKMISTAGRAGKTLFPLSRGHLQTPLGLPPIALAANRHADPLRHLAGMSLFYPMSCPRKRGNLMPAKTILFN
jgi:hypothetical protein